MSFVADVFDSVFDTVGDLGEGIVNEVGDIGGEIGKFAQSDLGKAAMLGAGAYFGFGGGSLFGDGAAFGADYGLGAGGGFPGMTEIASFAPGAGGGDIMAEIAKKYGLGQSNPWLTALNVGSGLYGLKQSRDIASAAKEGAARMDPFGAQRPQYQAQLSQLMADPSKITSMPGYKAGLDAVERKMASQGYVGSGNMMAALQDYGGNVFNQEAMRLATLAGANISPSGGDIAYRGLSAASDASSRALATLGFSAKQIGQILAQR